MFKYAQILHNKVHWIFESEETLDEMYLHRYSRDMVFIDITDRPEVQEGWDYDGVNFSKPPELTTEEKLNAIRKKRNQLLVESDWTDTLSAKSRLGEDKYNAWQQYRQALRDMPETCDVDNPIWPIKPQ